MTICRLGRSDFAAGTVRTQRFAKPACVYADIESDVDLAVLNKISEVADTPAAEVFACSPDESIHEMFLRTKRIAEILPAYRYGRARLAQIKGIK